jgi:predicted nuclease of predicted toxin-antitoxin system
VKPRLYLYEDVVPELAHLLRSNGHNAISVHEIGALELEDAEQLEQASRDGRTLLTYNYHDFLRINEEWLLSGRSRAGIVISYRQYSRRELGALFRTVVALLDSLTAEALQDSVVVLDQFRGDDP